MRSEQVINILGMSTHPQRNTRQRQAIYSAIEEAGRPLTPQEILTLAQESVPELGIATVYRNLKVLLKEQLICTVELPAQSDRYEAIKQHHQHEHHHHFLCTKCHRAFEVHGCSNDFEAMVPEGFQMQTHEVVLYGFCAQCQKKAGSKLRKKTHSAKAKQ